MKISVKIDDIEISYEEEHYKTTENQDRNYISMCVEKALLLYSQKLEYVTDKSVSEDDDAN